MEVIKYQKKNYKQIIRTCGQALKQGKIVAYPTDTSYGLAADVSNLKALKKLYRIKERGFDQPVHVVVPSVAYAKKIVVWSSVANKLSKSFWPGPLTLVLEIKQKDKLLSLLSAKTGFLGLRQPKNAIALGLAKYLGLPITTTSANPSIHLSGGFDSYSAKDIISQFQKKKNQPDIVIDAGQLPRRKPSTLLKHSEGIIRVIRQGPISEKQILKVLKK